MASDECHGKNENAFAEDSDRALFSRPDQWTSNPIEALDFQSIDHALQFIRTWKLQEVELAFAFGDRQVKSVPLEKTALDYSED
jgi:hypothetical protein